MSKHAHACVRVCLCVYVSRLLPGLGQKGDREREREREREKERERERERERES